MREEVARIGHFKYIFKILPVARFDGSFYGRLNSLIGQDSPGTYIDANCTAKGQEGMTIRSAYCYTLKEALWLYDCCLQASSSETKLAGNAAVLHRLLLSC